MRGSFFCSRTWCAAIPTPTRSSDCNISSACCLVIPTTSFLPLDSTPPRGCQFRLPLSAHRRTGQLDLFYSRDQCDFRRQAEVAPQSLKILRIQCVINVLDQVAPQFGGRQPHFRGCFCADLVQMLYPEGQRLLEVP